MTLPRGWRGRQPQINGKLIGLKTAFKMAMDFFV